MKVVKVDIKQPIWDGRKVGIADFRVKGDAMVHMTVSYKDINDNLVFPYTYVMPTKKIRTYPTQNLKSGVTLYLVPISDWMILN